MFPRRSTEIIKVFIELSKLRIALFSALSASTGFILAGAGPATGLLTIACGVFLLACGACSLNQYQERDHDLKMNRTKMRPLPSGRIKPAHGLIFSLALIMSGFVILFLLENIVISALGLFAVIWYNGIYTFLKKKTAFAAVPGAVTGAVPPVMGWIAGNGLFPSYEISVIAFFFFMWQIPHFWLIMLSHDGDYANSGYPSLLHVFSEVQIKRITCIWIAAAAVSALFLPLYIPSSNVIIPALILLSASWLAWKGSRLVSREKNMYSYIQTFKAINAFMLVTMFLMNFEKLLGKLS